MHSRVWTAIALTAGILLHANAADKDWPVYLGDKASSQYSTLDQINSSNVHRLEVAWTFNTGDADQGNRSQMQCNPLVIDGVLFGTSPKIKLFAINAETGIGLWRFDPASLEGFSPAGVNRGLVYWADGEDRRILFGAGHHLHAVNAATGELINSFGDGGRVNLKKGLGRDVDELSVASTTPGVLYRDFLIMGMALGEGPAPAAPGHIRAYNVRTGELVWRFNTIPQPGEFGYETWPPDAYTHIGGANAWTGLALDEERGIVFCPTGSAAFDFWGGNRIGENLFANCLIALNANTGQRIWHYQFVRHDLFDRDLPTPPNLVTVKHDGKQIDAVAQVTKSGHVFVFNRETGEPLFPIEEIVVPPSDLQGESTWPTQPLPTKPAPFSRQLLTHNEITDISPESHRAVLDRFVELRPHTLFMPPSTEGTIIFPGFDGGGEWGGAAVDPEGILYVNGNEMPWVLEMVETRRQTDSPLSSGESIYLQICAACHGLDRRGSAAQGVASLVDVSQRLKPEDVVALLQTGKGKMPSFGFLSDAQKRAVTDHLWLLDASGGTNAESSMVDARPQPSKGSSGRESALTDNPESRPPEPEIELNRLTSSAMQEGALLPIPYTHTGYNRWFDPEGYPAVKPPWGTLNAIDLNTGEYKWRVTLGEFPELTARGIPPTGTENYGGPVVTAGGVIFIAASKDEHIRAFDRRTGRELWKHQLPAGGYATPAIYEVNGRQYVVIACGGGKMGTESGDAYVAFGLVE